MAKLLPAGALSTSGNQIVDSAGNPVRIASVGWSGGSYRNTPPDGLANVNYKTLMDQVKSIGFNCLVVEMCDRAVLNNDAISAGSIDYNLNPDLSGKTILGVFDSIVAYAGTNGLRIIFRSHTNEGGNNVNFGARNPNGLWYDLGGASNGTDGGGNTGTITDALFQQMWTTIATRYQSSAAVIGYDLRNDPIVIGTTGATWGDGSNRDIRAMYQRVGNAIQAIDSRPLIICEGPQNPGTQFASTATLGGGSGQDGACGDLTGVVASPVVLNTANKVVYSIHHFPAETSGIAIDAGGPAAIARMNAIWGWLVKSNLAPVFIGAMGSYFNGTSAQISASTAWAQTLVSYCNGTSATGPTFNGNQQGVSTDWWVLQVDTSGSNAISAFGILTAWSGGTARGNQFTFYSQLFFGPATPQLISAPLASATTGTWLSGDLPFTGLFSGKPFHYNVLLPSGYSAAATYPLVVYEHENNEGSAWYDGSKTDPLYIVPQFEIDGAFNSVPFRLAYPCIVIVPYCDQTDNSGGVNQNFGGYNDGPTTATQANERAVAALIQYFISNFSVYPGKVYVTGDSLGGHGSIAMALDYNSINGTSGQIVTAALSYAGQIFRSGEPSTATKTRMTNVPLFCVAGAFDTTSPQGWQKSMFDFYNNTTNQYPGPKGSSAGYTGYQAGSSSFYYLLDPNLGHDVWTTYRQLPGGKPMYDWLFSQTTGGIVSTPNPTPTPTPAGTRNWWESPGIDGSFWVTPFYSTAQFTTTGTQVTLLRNGNAFTSPTGHVHLKGDFSPPFYVGRATDPLWTVQMKDGSKTIHVRIPAGAIPEEPFGTVGDTSMAGADTTQPYLVWCAGGVTISGTTISCNYGLVVDDGAGEIMCDQVTGQNGNQNIVGTILDYELTRANADPNYVIQHMLQFATDNNMVSNAGPIWPIRIIDTSFPNNGTLPQGITIGIPATTARPLGKTRGWYLLFDNLQQYGWLWNNVSGTGCTSVCCYSTDPANAALASDLVNSISDVMGYIGILANQAGLSTMKGRVNANSTLAFSPPPLLDLTPTGGINVAPSTFGAWYPSGYNVTPPTPVATPTPTPTPFVFTTPGTGKIIDPNGNVFIARGLNAYEDALSSISTSSNVTPLLTLFPKLNFVRVVAFNYNPPSFYTTFINQATAKGIVVLIEHHSGAGGGVPPLTGSDLTAENTWFQALATAFKTNPYVWFGTLNEPGNPASTVTTEQISNYNTIRGAGANNIIAFQVFGDYPDGLHYTIGAGHGLTTASYAVCTNVIWDFHFYNGLPHFNAGDGSGSYSTDQTFLNNLVATYIAQAQTIPSLDGIMPVIIGEYGPATDGNNVDPGGLQTQIAVQQSGVGSAAWNWASGAASDNLTDGSNNLTTYGTQVEGWINSGPPRSLPPTPGPTPTPTPTPTAAPQPPIINVHVGMLPWAPSTQKVLGDRVTNNGIAYKCALPGLTASVGGPQGFGTNIVDGTVHWAAISAVDANNVAAAISALPSVFIQNQTIAISKDSTITTTNAVPILTTTGHTMGTFSLTITAAKGDSIRDGLANESAAFPLGYNSNAGTTFLLPLGTVPALINYVDVNDQTVIIDGLQFRDPQSTSGSSIIAMDSGCSSLVIRNCIIDGFAQPGGATIIQAGFGQSGTVLISNCLIIDRQPAGGTGGAITVNSGITSFRCVNCTIINVNSNTAGSAFAVFNGYTGGIVKNCAIFGYSTVASTAGFTFDHCVTDAANFGSGIDGGNNKFSKTAAANFINPTSDWKLLPGADCLNSGVAALSDIPSGDDIAKTSRTQGTGWDVGCFERQSWTPAVIRPIPIMIWSG